MKIILLAAGLGKRLGSLTQNSPKALIEIAGKPFVQYLLDELVRIKDLEIGIVVGHLADQIVKKIGPEYKGIRLHYIMQNPLLGTGHAVLLSRNFVHKKSFLVYLADTYIIELGKIISELAAQKNHALVVSRVSDEQALRSGQVVISGNRVVKIVEKPKMVISNIASAGLYYFRPSIFNYLENVFDGSELELSSGIQEALKHDGVRAVFAKGFLDIGTTDGLKTANNYFGGSQVA